MDFSLTFTSTTWFLLLLLCIVIGLLVLSEKYNKIAELNINEIANEEPAGPVPFPVIGSLHLLLRYRVPFEAFRSLANVYGDVFKIKLGSIHCVVVNGLENIREVLMSKGDHFDGRPNFQRYSLIFNGDKRNSLAFCDWSELQKTRRELLRAHTTPQSFSVKFYQLDSYISMENNIMLNYIQRNCNQSINLKPLLLYTCANIFMMHFCGKRYEQDDKSFRLMIYYFDCIFYEVNQGYASDFIPWLLPFYRRHFNRVQKWTKYIREFMIGVVNERYSNNNNNNNNSTNTNTINSNQTSQDYIDTLIKSIKQADDKDMNMEIAMFSLEDIIGGHSAIANFLIKVFAYITTRPLVQEKIRAEIRTVTNNNNRRIRLTDRRSMPYTEAVILETMRLIASPIVPHVASQDSSIAGYKVKKGTMIFLNNFDLNYDAQLWQEPEQFNPERFLCNGNLVKPDHFFPFSTGRRSCMGYKMVQLLSFSIIAQTLQRFQIKPVDRLTYVIPIGDLALPYNTFMYQFVPY